mgnify:CR=1 FL=1
MKKLLGPVSRRVSMSLDGTSMAYGSCKNYCFYNEEAVEARIEAGLNEPRWSLEGICSFNHIGFNYVKTV